MSRSHVLILVIDKIITIELFRIVY